MSTDYRPIPAIAFIELFDGRLDKYGVREDALVNSTPRLRSLVGTDGILEAYQNDDGTSSFSRRSFNPIPWAVIDALTEEFGVELVSEHDHRYWGFASAKDWDDWNDKMSKQAEDNFYKDIVRYLRGKPNDLIAGTIGMLKAEIAKSLVMNDESLLMPINRHTLIKAVDEIYDQRHVVKIALTEHDLAAIEMMVRRTKELPQA